MAIKSNKKTGEHYTPRPNFGLLTDLLESSI